MTTRIRAMIWLHTLRLWRYRFTFLNNILTTILWLTIFVLGALMFVPKTQWDIMAPIALWGIIMWQFLSASVWYIGGWTWFFVSQGFVEEHLLTNTSPALVLVGRAIVGLSVTFASSLLVALVFTGLAGPRVLLINNVLYVVVGLVLLGVMTISYGLYLAALSFRIGIPGTLLDIANFVSFVLGGLVVPLSRLPSQLRVIALFIPYAHSAEIVRYGVRGLEPLLGLEMELALSTLIAVTMASTAYILFRYVLKHVRRYGVKAIGRM